ncbi:hypothetical protein OS493_031419 [Desmophyllum pertusum]|uniref:Uncharacterized protein n=1 Tax=Desmophyllum pertusum TaxID=174260 RepID=A0A9W9ZXR8_9CNID|nr:hypothetical protein OS493_031419 [Desmophyllum pertusum]
MKLTQRQQKQLIVHLFHKWLLADVHPELNSNYVPRDFWHLLTSALRVLYVNGKNNVLYHASHCFGEICSGANCPCMPLTRMPFGLILHNLRFLPQTIRQIWKPHQTASLVAVLHNGPMWFYIGSDVEKVQPSISADSIVCKNSQTDPNGCLNASTTTDIVAGAFQQTFGSDCELLQTATFTPVQSSPATHLKNNLEPNTIEYLLVSPEESGVSTEPFPLSSSSAPTSHLWASMG